MWIEDIIKSNCASMLKTNIFITWFEGLKKNMIMCSSGGQKYDISYIRINFCCISYILLYLNYIYLNHLSNRRISQKNWLSFQWVSFLSGHTFPSLLEPINPTPQFHIPPIRSAPDGGSVNLVYLPSDQFPHHLLTSHSPRLFQ